MTVNEWQMFNTLHGPARASSQHGSLWKSGCLYIEAEDFKSKYPSNILNDFFEFTLEVT